MFDNCKLTLYTNHMIKNYKSRALKRFYERGEKSQVSQDHAEKIERILDRLNIAKEPKAMALPSLRLHPLRGDMKGFWSVTVSGNWRIVFRFAEGHACDVDLIDYH